MTKRDRESLTGQAREILLSISGPEPLMDICRRHQDIYQNAFSVAANQLVADRALVSWVDGSKRGRRRIVAPAGTSIPPDAVSKKAPRPRPSSTASAPPSGIVAAAITLLEARDLDDKTARAAALSLLRKHR